MFAPSIALAIGAKFVPLSKPGQLPGTEDFKLFLGTGILVEIASHCFIEL